jgi:hypothetical protein
VKIGYRKRQINGEWFIWDEKGEKRKKKCLEGEEKKRRRTGEKRYKEKVNKKVVGQRKRKQEKKHKAERGTQEKIERELVGIGTETVMF